MNRDVITCTWEGLGRILRMIIEVLSCTQKTERRKKCECGSQRFTVCWFHLGLDAWYKAKKETNMTVAAKFDIREGTSRKRRNLQPWCVSLVQIIHGTHPPPIFLSLILPKSHAMPGQLSTRHQYS